MPLLAVLSFAVIFLRCFSMSWRLMARKSSYKKAGNLLTWRQKGDSAPRTAPASSSAHLPPGSVWRNNRPPPPRSVRRWIRRSEQGKSHHRTPASDAKRDCVGSTPRGCYNQKEPAAIRATDTFSTALLYFVLFLMIITSPKELTWTVWTQVVFFSYFFLFFSFFTLQRNC